MIKLNSIKIEGIDMVVKPCLKFIFDMCEIENRDIQHKLKMDFYQLVFVLNQLTFLFLCLGFWF